MYSCYYDNSGKLYWKPVNKDVNPANYSVDGCTISYDKESNQLYTVIDDLGDKITNSCADVTNEEKFILMYNTKEVALNGAVEEKPDEDSNPTTTATKETSTTTATTITTTATAKSIKKAKVSKIKNVIYSGYQKKPSVVVKYQGKKLKKNKDYTISYKNNTKVGTAKVIIKGKGDYSGKKVVTFKIKKRKKGVFAKGIYKVNVRRIKGRAKAGSKAKVKKVFKKGTKLEVTKVVKKKTRKKTYTWLKVKYKNNTYYVYGKYVI